MVTKRKSRVSEDSCNSNSNGNGSGGIDAVAILNGLSEESLAKSINEAQQAVNEATAHLRALQTLQKVVQFRSGKIKRKAPRKSVKSLVIEYLRREGPAKPATIVAALGEPATDSSVHTALVLLQNQGQVTRNENGYIAIK